jgi:hypothetical protein
MYKTKFTVFDKQATIVADIKAYMTKQRTDNQSKIQSDGASITTGEQKKVRTIIFRVGFYWRVSLISPESTSDKKRKVLLNTVPAAIQAIICLIIDSYVVGQLFPVATRASLLHM